MQPGAAQALNPGLETITTSFDINTNWKETEICFSVSLVFDLANSFPLHSVGKRNESNKRNNHGELKWRANSYEKKNELYKHKITLQLMHLEL